MTVGEVTRYLQNLFDVDATLSDVWIEGEVIESSVSGAGHRYFSLADEETKLNCVLFRSAALRQRYLPSVGQGCAVHGRVSIYPKEGRYQLLADFVRPAGVGLAALELELLKQQLAAEGLFEPGRKRPLPDRVRVVGLVTSAEGAVRHDVATVLHRRNPFLHLLFSPATVQGATAPASLLSALHRLVNDHRCDAIIIGRGGGSSTDLAAFNDERLVRAVFASPIPVVSAVGHESDWTLLDLVADVRAATPSAAAEIVSMHSSQAARQLQVDLMRHHQQFQRIVMDRMLDIGRFREDLLRSGPLARIKDLRLKLDEQSDILAMRTTDSMRTRHEMAERHTNAAAASISGSLAAAHASVQSATGLLTVLNPKATLDRGYVALTDDQNGLPVSSVTEVTKGRRMIAHTRDGLIRSIVESTQAGAVR